MPRPWLLLATFIVVAAVLIGGVLAVYRYGAERLKEDQLADLHGVAQLKVATISRWLDERKANTDALSRDPAFIAALTGWLVDGNAPDRSSVTGTLTGTESTYAFSAASLIYPDGHVLLREGDATLSGARLEKAIEQAQAGNKVVMVDLYRPDPESGVRMAFVAPITAPPHAPNIPYPLVVLEIRPSDDLYQILDPWPAAGASGEAVLVRREWNAVVYLNNLRNRPDSALRVRQPLELDSVPTAKLLLGQAPEIEGDDYRNVRVLAAAAAVPGTPWFVLAKVDSAEAFAGIRQLGEVAIVLILAALAGAAAVTAFAWQRQRLHAALREIEQKRATAAAELRFKATFEQAPVGIAHLDLDGSWLRVNPKFHELTGFTRDELAAHEPRELFQASTEPLLEECIAKLIAGDAEYCGGERFYRRPDGSEIWVEAILTLVRAADRVPQFLTLAITDITERKGAEFALRERVKLHEFLVKIAKTVPGMIYSFKLRPDKSSCMPYAAPNLVDIYGLEPVEVLEDASALLDRIHPADRERVMRGLLRSSERMEMWDAEFRILHPKKGEVWVEDRAAPERDADGGVVWHGFVRDITERKRADAQLREAAAVFTNTQEGVIIADPGGTIVGVNPSVCAITGYSQPELIGQNMRMFQSGRHDKKFYQGLWGSLASTGSWQGEIWNRRKSGELYPELLTISTVRDDNGEISRYVATFTDITRIKQSQEQLEHLAHHDPLTGLPNRLMLVSRLGHAVDRVVRHRATGAVLFLDLDRFKNVNDSLGHPAGDELLVAVAQRLRARLRESDTLARLGGDEFVAVLEDLGDVGQAGQLAQILIDRLSEPFELTGGHEVYIGASIGVSLFPLDGELPHELIQKADTALYAAKEAGKGVYRYYRTELTEVANARLGIEGRLRRALDRGEMVLHYQPLVTIGSNRATGVEALVRWQDPSEGLVRPDRFIPLAEETGLIVPLGDWVLREACRQFKAWRAAGIAIESIAVNLSPRQFQLPDIADRVRQLLEECDMPPTCLELEITENGLMQDGDATLEKFAALKSLGVRLAIDDFGTGYSSLSYLKRFPIDKLKVDQSFVRDIPGDTTGMEIATAVIGLAKTLHLEVLAEGVETEAQLDFLRQRGCDTAQGYLFARPLPAAELVGFFQAQAGDLGETPWPRSGTAGR